MGAVEFDPDEITVELLRGNECRAGAAERVKHDPASFAKRPDEGLQRFDWLLRGMKAIAGVCEVDDIGQRKFRRGRVTFCQKDKPVRVGSAGNEPKMRIFCGIRCVRQCGTRRRAMRR